MNPEIFLKKLRSETTRHQDLRNVAADITHYQCRIPVNNTGEARPVVMFPCKYSTLPTISFGFELHSKDYPGKMPVFAASVDEWYTIDKLPGSRLYTGCRLLIASQSVHDVAFVVTASVSGIAYVGPTDR